MKICIIGDVHIGIMSDDMKIRKFQLKFFKEVLFPELKKQNIKNIMFLMDIFDRRKYLNNFSFYEFKTEVFDYLEREDIHCDIGPGNHDLFFKESLRTNSIDLYLRQYKNINIIQEPTELQYGSTKFLYLPWICQENYEQSMKAVETTTAEVAIAHLELKGFLDGATLNESGMDASLFHRLKIIFSGHFHERSKKDNINYLGTPYELSWNDYGKPRGAFVFDTETHELTEIPNPYTFHEKIFYNDESPEFMEYLKNFDISTVTDKKVKLFVQKKTNKVLFENFIEKLYKTNMVEFQIIEDISEFHESNVEVAIDATTSTNQLIENYIDGVDTEMDKGKIKSIMQKLYLEALMGDAE